MKKSFLLISILLLGIVAHAIYTYNGNQHNNIIVDNVLIWKGNKYAAFTSLIKHDGFFYCAFREANMHADLSGTNTGGIVVLKSKDGDNWEKFCVAHIDGFDLRDPQLFTNSDKHLFLLVEKVKYVNGEAIVRESCYIDLMGDPELITVTPIRFENNISWNWLWNISILNDTIYGFTYAPYFALYKSVDGKQYKHVSTPNLCDQPTESAIIDLSKDTFLAVVRQSEFAAIGKSHDNGRSWAWKQSSHRLGCPKMIHYKSSVILVARNTDEQPHTSIYLYNNEKEDFDVICDLPDSGDCSYPGIVENNGYLYISYYQSKNNMHSDIYLAKLKVIII